MKTFALLITLMFSFAVMANCQSDQNLEKAGFSVYSSNFSAYLKDAENFFNSGEEFVPDLDGTIFSSVANAMDRVQGHDSMATPRGTMYGDIVFLSSFRSDKIIEVRWYEDGQKKVAYDSTFQPCATNVVPMAINALF